MESMVWQKGPGPREGDLGLSRRLEWEHAAMHFLSRKARVA